MYDISLSYNHLLIQRGLMYTQPKFKKSKVFMMTLTVGLLTSSMTFAEDNPALVVELINRVGAIENENRELRGQVEEARHQLSQLNQRMETLNADIDYRLNNPDSGGAAVGASLAPLPLGEVEIENSGAPTSPEEAYDQARSLLEQGDYAAAEHAFSAFVGAHPKHEQAGAAQYWLGVTHFVRGENEKAAAAFAKGYKTYPKCSKASDTLLKLAKTLALQNRQADACMALEQLQANFPKAHVKEVVSERKKSKCE